MDTTQEERISGPKLRSLRVSMKLSQVKLAEITGLSQYVISAYELGKIEVTAEQLARLVTVVSDSDKVTAVVSRKKRYQTHTYAAVRHDPARKAKATQTPRNVKYLETLDSLWKSHKDNANKKRTALSLFSGCGGFSLGFSAAGFKIKGHIELVPELREIYKRNFPESQCLGGDVSEFDASQIQAFREKIGGVEVLIGGPPCQGFSLTGKRQVDDPRNLLFKSYMKFVDAFEPKVAVVENVRLLTSMRNPTGGWVKDDIASEFSSRGYRLQLFEVNSMDYGIPQSRGRVFFVATRGDLKIMPSFPTPTHHSRVGLFEASEPSMTFADACSDLPYLESGETSSDALHRAVKHPSHVIEWLWDVAEGFSAHDNTDPSKRPPSGYNTTYKRQVWNEPAATVQTTFGMISGSRNVHPISTRSLTIREAARLQSFPDQFAFSGNDGAIRTGIGNAVPPLLSYQIARHLDDLI